MRFALLTLLFSVLATQAHAKVDVANLKSHIGHIYESRSTFAKQVNPDKVFEDLERSLSSSDSMVVASAIDFLTGTTALGTELMASLSADQKAALNKKLGSFVDSSNAAIRFIAMRAMVTNFYVSQSLQLLKDIATAIGNEPEKVLREEIKTQVLMTDRNFDQLQIVIPSAEWCGPCHVLKANFKKENLPLKGTLKFDIKGKAVEVSYRIIDADEESELYYGLGLSSSLPSVNLVKNGRMIRLEYFSSSNGKPLTPAGFRKAVEATLSSYFE